MRYTTKDVKKGTVWRTQEEDSWIVEKIILTRPLRSKVLKTYNWSVSEQFKYKSKRQFLDGFNITKLTVFNDYYDVVREIC